MKCFSLFSIPLSFALAAPVLLSSPAIDPVIQSGYRQMYDLNFDSAHKIFTDFEREHPADPLGPASNAAAYLFAEFDRLKILQSEFFVEDGLFKKRLKLTADPKARRLFDEELSKSEQLTDEILRHSPDHPEAMFAKILTLGLRADYQALIERRYLDSLKI